ncbi:MAG: PSD1 and planctomycete cytochrome C domain-containing protein [Pirellulales bacterium]
MRRLDLRGRIGQLKSSLVVACSLLAAGVLIQPAAGADEPIEFEKQVAPILTLRCVKCHGEGKIEAGFDVRRKFTIAAGGDSGPAIVDGKIDESLLWQRIAKHEMPPPEEGPLDESQKRIIRRWLEGGAKVARLPELPLDDDAPPSRVTAEDRAHWSFKPPARLPLPSNSASNRWRTPVDAWIHQGLTQQSLDFNPDADRRQLLRRLAFDLWGVPPTWEQWEEFRDDAGPDACERLVDRMLASPKYGERWGRRWLDVAGYADSDGYLAADRVRPEAWRYRDYVIDAHNADLPYDQFIREQLAGDEISPWRQAEELTPEMTRQLVATGFLRTASDPTYPGYTEPNEIHQVLSDTMQIVGSSFLGLTVQCARCHAHKFDPFSQRDYYALQAVFLPAFDPARWQPSEVRGIPWATEPQQARIAQQNQRIDEQVAKGKQAEAELMTRYRQRRWEELLAGLGQPLVDTFSTDQIDHAWMIELAGTAKSWNTAGENGELAIRAIDGGKGYALARLRRPVLLAGEFSARLVFRWHSMDSEPKTNKAMQRVLLQLRDAKGLLVGVAGYIDENNTARGSPILGAATAAEPIGDDLVAHYVKKHGQAVPPSARARSLAASGRAIVTLTRDAGGKLTATYEDGQVRESATWDNATQVTSIEVELRRYVLNGEASFEGLWLDEFEATPGPSSMLSPAVRESLAAALATDDAKQTAEQKKLIQETVAKHAPTEADLSQCFPEFADEIQRIRKTVQEEQSRKQTVVKIRGVTDLEGPAPPGRILRRGDYDKPGATLAARVPEVLSNAGGELPTIPGYKTTGRRLALAQWLADPRHPLTARVQVNRVWQGHFGRPLVATPANFGRSGAKPSHPELLDWLATELPRADWSLKSLHRLLVTSTVFRQSSEYTDEQRRRDPENRLWGAWTPKRHDGETLRDSVLAVSGKMNGSLGGKPSPVLAQGDGSVLTADDAAGNRRSIYLMVRRSQHLTMLDLFDTPLMEVNCTERNTSTVPLQALALLHSPFADQNAKALGERLWRSAADDVGRVQWAVRWVYTREPTSGESQDLLAFVDQTRAAFLQSLGGATPEQIERASRAAWEQLALVLMNENEFLYE